MQFLPIKTRKILPPQDNIYDIFDTLPKLKEGDVLLVTSKILAIHQGRCIPMTKVGKDKLIMQEAERYIPRSKVLKKNVLLTLKYHTLIPSAGIDESNGNGYYILWPRNIQKEAKKMWEYLRKKYKVKKLGVIITDSHCVPQRKGVLGTSIGFYGLEPVRDYRGKKDIFGRKLEMTQANVVDTLAVMGVLLIGESAEKTPLLLIRGSPTTFTNQDTYRKLVVNPKEDIFAPLLKVFYDKKKQH